MIWKRRLLILLFSYFLFFIAPPSLFAETAPEIEKAFAEARVLYQKAQDKEAETLLLQILEKDPTLIRPRQFLGLIYARTNRVEKAISVFQELIKMSPKYWGGYYGLGLVAKQVGALAQANQAFKAAIGFSQRDNPQLWLDFAQTAEAQKKMDEAIPAYQKVIEVGQQGSKAVLEASNRLNEIGHDAETATKIQTLLEQATQRAQSKDYKGALPLYREAADLLPSGRNIRYLLGNIASLAGNYEQSQIALQEAIEIDPSYVAAHFALARLLELTGKISEAIISYETILTLSRDETIPEILSTKEALFSLLDQEEIAEKTNTANRLVSEGKWPEAEQHFKEALAIRPGRAVLHYNLANFYHQSNQNTRAEEVIQQALLIEPDSRALKLLQAGVYRERRYFIRSMASYVKVMSLLYEDPDNLLYLTAFSGLIQSAVLFQKATAEARPLYFEGLQSQSKRQPVKPLSLFLRASSLLPESPVIAYSVGTIYSTIGENRQAYLQYKNAVEFDSGFYVAHLALARVATKEKRYVSAISSYQRLLRLPEIQLAKLDLKPQTLKREFLATVYAWQKAREQTRIQFKQAVTAATPEQRINILLAAKNEEPENSALLFSLGIAYASVQNWVESEKIFQEVLEIDPSYPGARLRLAVVQEESQQLYKAKRSYEKILNSTTKDSPDQQIVQERLEALNTLIKQRQIASRHAKRGVLVLNNPDATREMYENALWEFEQAVMLYPEATQFRYNLGLVQERLIFGKEGLSEAVAKQIWDDRHFLDKPIQTYEATIEQNQNFAPVYIQLARLYGAIGEEKKAIAVYKKALAVGFNPEMDEVKQIKAGLAGLEKRFSGSMSFISTQDSNFALTIPAVQDFSNTLSINLSYILYRKQTLEIPISYFQLSTPYYNSQIFFSSHGLSLGLQDNLTYSLSYKFEARYNASVSEGSGLSSLQARGSGSITYRRRIPTSTTLTYNYSDMVFDSNKDLNRTGQQIGLALTQQVTLKDSLSFSYGYVSQDVPKAPDNDYQGHVMNLQIQRRLSESALLRLSGGLDLKNFLNVDSRENEKRKNTLYSYGAGLTIPWTSSISLTFDYLFQKNESNIDAIILTDQDIAEGRTTALGDYQKRVWTVGVSVVF